MSATDVLSPTPAVSDGRAFADLSRAVKSAGLLERRRIYYSLRIGLNTLMYGGGVIAFVTIGASWWQLLTAVFLGIVFTQTAFWGHDAGHGQVFRTRRANDALGYIFGNLGVGLSFGWWNRKHNAHHRNPNHEDLDPDVGPGVIAFTERHARNQRGMLRRINRRQAFLFVPLLLLEGLALHVASFQAIRAGRVRRAKLEVGLLVAHVLGYLTMVFLVLSPLQALAFIAVQQGVFGLYMGASFTPNHTGMPILTGPDRNDFFRTQVLTARNVHGGRFTDYALGGLNYQIEHHLFPSMPRPNLRRVQHLVQEFCELHEVTYTSSSLLESYRQSLQSLHSVSACAAAPDPATIGASWAGDVPCRVMSSAPASR